MPDLSGTLQSVELDATLWLVPVLPLLASRSLDSPVRHPAWQELRFLETHTGGTPAGAPTRESDLRLARFLMQDDWHERSEQLRRTLAADPSWTARPLLDALTRLEGGSFWSRLVGPQGQTRAQIVALLDLLRSRPDQEVLERVRPYLRHRQFAPNHRCRRCRAEVRCPSSIHARRP